MIAAWFGRAGFEEATKIGLAVKLLVK